MGRVVRRVKYSHVACVEIQIGHSIVSVPQWMTQADLCQRFTYGPDPIPNVESLLQVLRLLDAQRA